MTKDNDVGFWKGMDQGFQIAVQVVTIHHKFDFIDQVPGDSSMPVYKAQHHATQLNPGNCWNSRDKQVAVSANCRDWGNFSQLGQYVWAADIACVEDVGDPGCP